MKKRIAFFLVLSMILCMSMFCYSEESSRFLQEVKVEENSLVIYADAASAGEQYSVSFGGKDLSSVVQTVEESGEPVTFFCLVDVSKTMSGQSMDRIKEMLTVISSRMRQQDNMLIASFDEQVSVVGSFAAGKELKDSIENLSTKGKDEYLYAAVSESIQLLASGQEYHDKKCLIVFSAGEDHQENGVTEAGVLQAAAQAEFPLYTVAVMTQADSSEGRDTFKNFSQASAGGEYYAVVCEENGSDNSGETLSGQAVAESICADVFGGSIIRADLNDFVPDTDSDGTMLKVTLASDSRTLTETRTILTNDLLEAKSPSETLSETAVSTVSSETLAGTAVSTVSSETTEETAVSTASTETTAGIAGSTASSETTAAAEESSDSDSGISVSVLLICAIAGAAVILIVVILVIIIKRKKKDPDENRKEDSDENQKEDSDENQIETESAGGDMDKRNGMVIEEPRKIAPVFPKIPVFILEIPYGRNPVSFEISSHGEKTTVGRPPKADVVLNETDNLLSHIHFSLAFRDGKYWIMDENSRNGTLLNNANISGRSWVVLTSGDTIRVGSAEYRILLDKDALKYGKKAHSKSD